MAFGQFDGFLAVAGLADDFVTLLSQHFGQVQSDEGFVFGDQDTTRRSGVGVGRGACHDRYCVVNTCDQRTRGRCEPLTTPILYGGRLP